MKPKVVAIIGAGVAGIGSAKCCLEAGLQVVVFEKTNYIGGLWHYHEDIDENGIASVMKSTVINTSKEVSSFSDFPPKKENSNYMHHTANIAYYEDYADSFNFRSYVRFRHQIVEVKMSPDYEETGRWTIRYQKLDQNCSEEEETFDAVMVCIGHHNVRNEPKFRGQEKFKGKIMHTHSVKHARGFEDKTVVVVGIGNSATDCAVELATVTQQVYLSTRRGAWIFHRVGHNGVPFDLTQQTRFNWFLVSILPHWLVCTVLEWHLNSYFDHSKYGLKPKHRALSAHITMNDALPCRIMCGTVKVKPDIDYFTEEGVVFKGEEDVTKCDVVIFGTGYKVSIPFLSQSILPVYKNRVRLYKHIFIPSLKHPQTLGIMGLFQSVGAGIPCGELQGRYFAALNAGTVALPNRKTMEMDIEKKLREIEAKYYQSERHTFQVNWVPYMDELASEIAVKPPLLKYLFTDLKLFYALLFGPAVPYQYRLVGPNKWSKAREAILTVHERIEAPMKTNAEKSTAKRELNDLTFTDALIYFAIVGMILSVALTVTIVKVFKL